MYYRVHEAFRRTSQNLKKNISFFLYFKQSLLLGNNLEFLHYKGGEILTLALK